VAEQLVYPNAGEERIVRLGIFFTIFHGQKHINPWQARGSIEDIFVVLSDTRVAEGT
jgi:hypothetical protein